MKVRSIACRLGIAFLIATNLGLWLINRCLPDQEDGSLSNKQNVELREPVIEGIQVILLRLEEKA